MDDRLAILAAPDASCNAGDASEVMTGLAILAVTGFSIAVTVGAYTLSLWARKRYPSPVTTPVLFSTVIIIATLLASGISSTERHHGPPCARIRERSAAHLVPTRTRKAISRVRADGVAVPSRVLGVPFLTRRMCRFEVLKSTCSQRRSQISAARNPLAGPSI